MDQDEELVAGVKESMKEAHAGKGKIVKAKELDKYLKEL